MNMLHTSSSGSVQNVLICSVVCFVFVVVVIVVIFCCSFSVIVVAPELIRVSAALLSD